MRKLAGEEEESIHILFMKLSMPVLYPCFFLIISQFCIKATYPCLSSFYSLLRRRYTRGDSHPSLRHVHYRVKKNIRWNIRNIPQVTWLTGSHPTLQFTIHLETANSLRIVIASQLNLKAKSSCCKTSDCYLRRITGWLRVFLDYAEILFSANIMFWGQN